jgi:hypothetical protein
VSAITEGIEICHGYCLDDLSRFAGYAMHSTYWQRAMIPSQLPRISNPSFLNGIYPRELTISGTPDCAIPIPL